MNMSKYQRATSKTRRAIQSAFAELLAERGNANNITVTELAERAEITRGTFYNYYNNINEIRVELQSEIEKRLFSGSDDLSSVEGLERYVDDIFVYLKQQEAIYRGLLATNATIDFLKQLENEMSQSVLVVMHKIGVNSKETDLELLFLTNGAIAIARKYYQGEVSLTLDEIRDYLKTQLRRFATQ